MQRRWDLQLILRVDTRIEGTFHHNFYKHSIDIVERTNLWLWTFANNHATVQSYGIPVRPIRTFKAKPKRPLTPGINSAILDRRRQ
jgi:hypothetical protein